MAAPGTWLGFGRRAWETAADLLEERARAMAGKPPRAPEEGVMMRG